jgi:hypothetical protein
MVEEGAIPHVLDVDDVGGVEWRVGGERLGLIDWVFC